MTQTQSQGVVPDFNLGDRLRKALQVAHIEAGDMADYLGYDRRTISRWINGKGIPRKGTIAAWALRTGIDREWLETGVRHQGLEPRTRWFESLPVATTWPRGLRAVA